MAIATFNEDQNREKLTLPKLKTNIYRENEAFSLGYSFLGILVVTTLIFKCSQDIEIKMNSSA